MSGILLSRLKKINPKPLVRKDVNQPSLYRSTSQKNWWPQESLQAEVKTGRLVQSQFKEQLVQIPFLIMHSWETVNNPLPPPR